MENEILDEIEIKAKLVHIPINRLLILGIVSCGVYELYWMYKNWKYIKENYNSEILPFWRAVFGIFYIHTLFHNIENLNVTKEVTNQSLKSYAIGWVLVTILSTIFFRIIGDSITAEPTLNVLSIVFSLSTIMFFIPIQKSINKIYKNRNPNSPYTEWSVGSFISIFIGIILWVITLAPNLLIK